MPLERRAHLRTAFFVLSGEFSVERRGEGLFPIGIGPFELDERLVVVGDAIGDLIALKLVVVAKFRLILRRSPPFGELFGQQVSAPLLFPFGQHLGVAFDFLEGRLPQ